MGVLYSSVFFFNDTATTEIYTLSLHDALPISPSYASTGSASATKATVILTGQLTQEADGHLGDLTKATAQFLLYTSANVSLTTPDITVNATVNASGVATGTASNLAIDTYTVILRVTPSNTYFG